MKKCKSCGAEDIDEDLADEGICSECGEEFDSDDLEDEDVRLKVPGKLTLDPRP